jgi:FkbH-like protein
MVSKVQRYPLIEHAAFPDQSQKLRLLLLGTCAALPMLSGLNAIGMTADHHLCASHAQEPIPPFDSAGYDAVVVSLTLRHILIDAARELTGSPDANCLYWPRAVAEGREQAYLDACLAALNRQVDRFCKELAGKTIFFVSFLEPKHNYLGNLLPRYALSNPAYFVQKLNEGMESALTTYRGAYFFDANEIVALLGGARIRDDYVFAFSHASYLADDPFDKERIVPSTRPTQMYEAGETAWSWGEVLARRLVENLAVLRQPLAIKAIIVDLDDTLWRGIAAEEDKPEYEFIEGWPLGIVEALLIYKARGGLLAICSKNDRVTIEQHFQRIYKGRLALRDFASVHINFNRKSDNVRIILDELNILEDNALFIDDDPREIDEIQSAFPRLHTFCAEHYDWRRKILMLPEMQARTITREAGLRTQSVQAKIVREQARHHSTGQWLESLGLIQDYVILRSTRDPHFARAWELVNKTNQFNTTGALWTEEQLDQHFRSGGLLVCSLLRDRNVNNGLIGVAVVLHNEITQVVLSCRVFNLQSEYATGHWLCRMILESYPEVSAKLIDTGRNFTCHSYFTNMGFVKRGHLFVSQHVPEQPRHIGSPGIKMPVNEAWWNVTHRLWR